MLAGSLVYLFILHSLLPRTSVVCSSQISGSLGSSLTSSVVESRTSNRESSGSNPLCYSFKVWAFLLSPRHLSSLSCMNGLAGGEAGIEIRKNFYMSAGHVTMSD